MISIQAELPLIRERQNADAGAEELCRLLRGAGWVKASTIQQAMPHWSERRIRLFANAANGRVMSFPGSQGYRLTVEATAQERDEAVAKLRHQAVEMGERANAIARVHHKPTHRYGIRICPVCDCQMSSGNWSPEPDKFLCETCFHMGREAK